MYDILIKNSTLYGLENGQSAQTDLAVKDGRIAKIGDCNGAEATKIIDADGLLTLPGFVDVHSHSDYYLLIDPEAQGKVMQGVTTDVGGNCGYSSAPIAGDLHRTRQEAYMEQFKLKLDWYDFAQYWERLSKNNSSINYAGMVGYNTLRGSVVGMEDTPVTADHMERLKKGIRENLHQGAAGVSIGLVYPPACFADRKEVAEALSEVQKADRIFATHIRSEGKTLVESIEEVIDIARMSGVKLHISHLKTAGKANWHKLDTVFDMIEKAQADGVDIQCDRYPYLASNTGLQVLLPDWAFDGGRDATLARLKDPAMRKKFREEILENHPEPEYWDNVMISQVVTAANKKTEGRTARENAEERGVDPIEFVFDLLIEEKTEIETIYFIMNQENMDRVLLKDYVMVGSDAGARTIKGPLGIGKPHPRTFGTFPRFFREYVFDRKLISIEDAVRKCSTMAARRFNLTERGELREGWHADIAIIDPSTIRDNTTYQEPLAYPDGVAHVIVNGTHTVEKGQYLGQRAGRGLKIG